MGELWVKVSPHLTSPNLSQKLFSPIFTLWVSLGEQFSPHLTSPKIFKKALSPKFTLWVSLGENLSPHLTSPKISKKVLSPKFTFEVSLGENFSPHPWVKVKGWICIPGCLFGAWGARDGIAGGDFGVWRLASSLKGSAGSQAGPSCTGFALCTSMFKR